MSYQIELSKILDTCNCTCEERQAIEQFLDGKVYQDRALYPDFNKSLPEMIKEKPHLYEAQKKIHQCGKWSDLMRLVLPLNWSQQLKDPK